MLNKMTYKKRNQVLLWGGVFLFVLVYNFTFKKTISLYFECAALEKKNMLAADAPLKIAALEKEAAGLDVLSGSQQHPDSNTQQAILGIISSYCQENKLLLKEFPETKLQKENDYLIETNSFILEGNFQKLQQLVYLLEQKYKIGKISSVDYVLKKDLRTNKKALTAAVFIQNIKKAATLAPGYPGNSSKASAFNKN